MYYTVKTFKRALEDYFNVKLSYKQHISGEKSGYLVFKTKTYTTDETGFRKFDVFDSSKLEVLSDKNYELNIKKYSTENQFCIFVRKDNIINKSVAIIFEGL